MSMMQLEENYLTVVQERNRLKIVVTQMLLALEKAQSHLKITETRVRRAPTF